MISALDTSVLIDVLWGDPLFAAASRCALEDSARAGALIVSPVVVAELRQAYERDEEVVELLVDLGIHVIPLETRDGLYAGAVHRRYRKAGGTRSRVVADFLIGAHAVHRADRLVARDRGFFRDYFSGLTVWYPAP
ncbi:MAG: PIN domain-containing protein [Spirochaetaceae bacterium]|nr:MAG: PIN domain-containing protein [Spirochaetaceae bacterium]